MKVPEKLFIWKSYRIFPPESNEYTIDQNHLIFILIGIKHLTNTMSGVYHFILYAWTILIEYPILFVASIYLFVLLMVSF